MNDRRGHLARFWEMITDEPAVGLRHESARSALERICRTARDDLAGSEAGITLMGADGWLGVAAATSQVGVSVEELQFTWGEGPCIDAFTFRRPVLVDDLTDHVWVAWPGYVTAAHDAGVRAVFAFPLQLGAACLGVLDVYRNRAGPLTSGELRDGLALAETAMAVMLGAQGRSVADGTDEGVEESLDYRIYQAQGMVGVQLGVGLVEAMMRLRAYALANDHRLVDIADAVLAGQLHLGGESHDSE